MRCSDPFNNARENLRGMRRDINEALTVNDEETVTAATKVLQDWQKIKKILVPKKDKNPSVVNSNNYGNMLIAQPNNTRIVIHNNTDPATSSITQEMEPGRVLKNQKKKRKYINAYLSRYYGETDFGNMEGQHSHWKVNDIDVTKALRQFRQASVEGAQQRKFLSNSRVLSLSFIFLFSLANNCVLSKLPPDHQKVILRSFNSKQHLKPIDPEVMIACQQMHSILVNDEMTLDEAEEANDRIKATSQNTCVKIVTKTVSNLSIKFFNRHNSNNQTQGEATLIIENIRPYLNNCTKYELFFVEVKRKGNYQNNHLEDDLVKLGKEMHTALNKLVKKKVRNPEVVGLLVEDCRAVAYKMNLEYNGQYQMIEISRFYFTRETVDDILLIPAIVTKLNQIKDIIETTITNIYRCISGDEELVDLTPYTRQACKTPVSILV
ncbi:hypothetical protein G6F56_005988 [Rhizopus delemar]|nr:hypothetical protein G6F56_005988 [Rhizopus delemar]